MTQQRNNAFNHLTTQVISSRKNSLPTSNESTSSSETTPPVYEQPKSSSTSAYEVFVTNEFLNVLSPDIINVKQSEPVNVNPVTVNPLYTYNILLQDNIIHDVFYVNHPRNTVDSTEVYTTSQYGIILNNQADTETKIDGKHIYKLNVNNNVKYFAVIDTNNTGNTSTIKTTYDYPVVELTHYNEQINAFKLSQPAYIKLSTFGKNNALPSGKNSYSHMFEGVECIDKYYKINTSDTYTYNETQLSWRKLYDSSYKCLYGNDEYGISYIEYIDSTVTKYKQTKYNDNIKNDLYIKQFVNVHVDDYTTYNSDLYILENGELRKTTYGNQDAILPSGSDTYSNIYQLTYEYIPVNSENDITLSDDIKKYIYININPVIAYGGQPEQKPCYVLLSRNNIYTSSNGLLFCDNSYALTKTGYEWKDSIYIKYNYKLVTSKSDLQNYHNQNKNIYVFNSTYTLTNIASDFIGNIDITGKTIYCDRARKVIDFTTVYSNYTKAIINGYDNILNDYNKLNSYTCGKAEIYFKLEFIPVISTNDNYIDILNNDDITDISDNNIYVEELSYLKLTENLYPKNYDVNIYEYGIHIVDSIKTPQYFATDYVNLGETGYKIDDNFATASIYVNGENKNYYYRSIYETPKFYRKPVFIKYNSFDKTNGVTDKKYYIEETENKKVKSQEIFIEDITAYGVCNQLTEYEKYEDKYADIIVYEKEKTYKLEGTTNITDADVVYTDYLYENYVVNGGVTISEDGCKYYTNLLCFNQHNKYAEQYRELIKKSKITDKYTYIKSGNIYNYSTLNESNEYYTKKISASIYGIISSSEIPNNHDIIEVYKAIDNTNLESKIITNEVLDISAVTTKVPIVLENNYKITDFNSYKWTDPEYGYVIFDQGDGTYAYKYVQKTAGFWQPDYNVETIPLQIASYTFYPQTDGISNISATYSFVPNSYILQSVVEYPEISYCAKENVDTRQFRYTYIGEDGTTQEYDINGPIEFDGLVYYGLAESNRVLLTQHSTVVTTDIPVEHIYQNKETKYNYFAYKTSIALTNETVPVLYNTELIPAITEKVSIWKDDQYVEEERIVSNAYYSYKYVNNIVPLVVASYNYQASYQTIDNFDILGKYIETSGNNVKTVLKNIDSGINNYIDQYKQVSNIQNINFTGARDAIIKCLNNNLTKLNSTLEKSTDTINNALDNLNNTLNTSIDELTYTNKNSLNSLKTDIKNSINNCTNTVSNNLTTLSNVLNSNITSLNNNLHNDIIGNGITLPAYSVIELDKQNKIVSTGISDAQHISTLAGVIEKAFIRSSTQTLSYTDKSTGNTHIVTNHTYSGLIDVLTKLTSNSEVPSKDKLLIDIASALYTSIDYETELTTDVEYDDQGNITKKHTKKNNPAEIATRSIMRAQIFYNVAKKAGLV
jgi:hypothetical protein